MGIKKKIVQIINSTKIKYVIHPLNVVLIIGYFQTWIICDFFNMLGKGFDGDITRSLISTLMLILSLLYMIRNNINNRQYNMYIIFLIIFMVTSTLWSSTPFISGCRDLIILLVYTIYLKNRYNTKNFLTLLNCLFFIVGILSVIAVYLNPEKNIQSDYMWKGIFYHKNNLGMAMAVGVIVVLSLLLQYKNSLKYSLFLCFSCMLQFFVLYKSDSATCLISAIVIVLLIIKDKFYPIKYIRVYVFGYVLISLFLIFFHKVVGYPISLITGKSPTFTGRTVIWDTCKEYFYSKPFLGYGYNGVWSQDQLVETVYYRLNEELITETHNGVFDLLLHYGLVGMSIFIIAINKYIKKIENNFEDKSLFFIFSILMVISFGESLPLSFNSSYIILFLFCLV